MTDNNTIMPATGTQVFVNWYGSVVEGKVLDHDQYASHPMYREWVAILMEIPASDGKPIVQGCFNICMFHKSHVYLTSEAAAQAWTDFRHTKHCQEQPAQPQQKPSFADTLSEETPQDKYINTITTVPAGSPVVEQKPAKSEQKKKQDTFTQLSFNF